MRFRDFIVQVVDERMSELSPRPVTKHGTVTVTSPLQVQLSGDTVSVPVTPVDGYVPTLGARALLVRFGDRLYAIGERDLP